MGSRARSEERRKKKKKKKQKRHRSNPSYSSSSSVSPSPSSSTEMNTSSSDSREPRERKPRKTCSSSETERQRVKHKKRRHSSRTSKVEKHSRKEKFSKRALHKCKTDEITGLPSPQEVASTMLIKFPDLAGDLKQLLKMLDEGQAVDLSGLANDHVTAYLKQLFQSLLLHKTAHGLYFLPDGASRKTSDVLSSVLSSPIKISDSVQEVREKEVEQIMKDTLETLSKDKPSDQYGPVEEKRRVMGPAMPSAEMLAAAARIMETGPSLREMDEDISMESFIGPPPPAAIKESESANEAERFEEVERILAPDIENAYDLLGLRVGASTDLLKRRYWKLSLLVHPDKCGHPQAHQAFTALNQAFKDLQDPEKRAKVEEQIQEKETRKEFEAEQKLKREAAEWRKIRGESLPGDDVLLDTPKLMVRDKWMTELPPERKPGAPTQQSTFFSKSGKSGRGDTSVWTDTPLDRVQKAKAMYLEGEKLFISSNESTAFYKEERDSGTAGIIDEFNVAKRGKSLLDKHQTERSKKVKKMPTKQEPQQSPDWAGSHPWKPWDREKDLTAGRQKVDLDKSNMAEGLSSRFASSHEERTFL